jgi:creatinine amidohydrolase
MHSRPSPLIGVTITVWLLAASALTEVRAQTTSLYIEDLTSSELQARIADGTTTVLVPIGGTEQNGPHMALGKHNVRVRLLAGLIALRLGNAVVAPVMAYAPEGSISPPVAHMRFTGTISMPESVFEAVLESTARSFKQHGFRNVFFLGDHGGYQVNEEHVAAKLDREWTNDPTCRVHALTDYYRVTQREYVEDLKLRGHSAGEIGTHAGLADTALMLALDKSQVRADVLAHELALDARHGVYGDPRRATAALGQLGVQRIVDASVAAIRQSAGARK